jgi:hypothetical protein
MEIQALHLRIAERDLNDLLARHLPAQDQLQELRITLAADGMAVQGVYKTVLNVPFETRWLLSVRDTALAAQLDDLKVRGFGGGFLKTAILGVLALAARREEALRVEGEVLLLDVDRLLLKQGLSVRTNLRQIRCEPGALVIECAAAPPSA